MAVTQIRERVLRLLVKGEPHSCHWLKEKKVSSSLSYNRKKWHLDALKILII